MVETLSGIVTKTVGGVFTVQTDKAKFTCFSPKKFRYNDFDVLVGDKVKFENLHKGKGVITEILPRKNKLHRPEIANVDVCFLVLSCQPKPDFYLADKVLINCFQEKIEPIILVNKMDIDDGTAKVVEQNYSSVCDLVKLTAFDKESVLALQKYVEGKTVCFAGQSAVGKTSILNTLIPSVNGEVGGLSTKTGRGMHTTRHSSLHKVMGGYVVDTCGFSLCDIQNVRSDELRLYWDDFVEVAHGCKYPSCTHTVEPDCAVKDAAQKGLLNADRYGRYLEEIKQLREAEQKEY